MMAHGRKHLYQWTAIDECTRIRFIYGFEEHTPENTVKFFYISDTEECPFDIALKEAGIEHKLIPPRTPWHNGKVERSHRNDQRYFYDWEHFRSLEEFNDKLHKHLLWSNRKSMRTLGRKSPVQLLKEKLKA